MNMEGTSASFCHIYFTKLLQSVNAKIGKALGAQDYVQQNQYLFLLTCLNISHLPSSLPHSKQVLPIFLMTECLNE